MKVSISVDQPALPNALQTLIQDTRHQLWGWERGWFSFYKWAKQGETCPRGDRGGHAQDAVDAGLRSCLPARHTSVLPTLSAVNASSSLELRRAVLFLSSRPENSCVITWLCLPSCCGCHQRTRESIEAARQGDVWGGRHWGWRARSRRAG